MKEKRTFSCFAVMANHSGVTGSASMGAGKPFSKASSDGGRWKAGVWKYAAMVVVLLTLGIGNAWGNGYGILHLTSETPAKGLVYANANNTAPSSDDSYAASSNSASASVSNSNGSAPRDFYGWAKGARGWKWASWSIGETVSNPSNSNAGSSGTCTLKSTTENGNVAASVFTLNGGRNTSSERLVTAKWKEDDNATITYAQTIGGSYNVNYKYVKVNNSNKFESISKDYTISPTSGDVKPSETAWDGSTDNRSYVNDKITLSTTAANLLRWEEVNAATSAVTALTPTVNGTTRSYVYQVVKDRTATIRAVFKSAGLGEVGGDKQISVNNLTNVYDYSLTVPVTDIIGDWAVGDFTVTFNNQDGPATITPGDAQYAPGLLTIPFTYKANLEGNTTIDVTVSTPYGAQTNCQILATAEIIVDYEAQILLAGQTDPEEGNTGTLAAMLAKANGMSGDFTLKLMNPVEITEPLSFTNTFTFDINGKTITSTGNAAISIDAAGINVHFIDDSFVKAGKIKTEKSYDGVIGAVRFTAAGQITLDGGTIIAHNTSTATEAKAHAVEVSNGGVFFMTAGSYGRVSAEADNEAVAIYVATASDYATMNGGVVEALANANAYGLWSAGIANITGATINSETQTGVNAYGVYVNGSTTTLANTSIVVSAKTTQAYGAYVKTGRLNLNGGSVVANANSDVYGVHVAAGATASVLMRANITANATTAGNARGLNNLGTLIINNANVLATAATTGATAVNSETSAVNTKIDGGLYVATAGSGTVYGLHHQYGDLTVDGGEFHGIATGGSAAYGVRTVANGTIKNATMWGETQGVAHTAYGYVAGTAGKTTTLTKCTIKGESVAATAYAIYSRAIVEATDCELTATANNGDKAAAFWAENGTNTITRCNATATASEAQAWGVNHLAGACTISGGSYTVLARQAKASAEADTKAYGVQTAASLTTNISDVTFSVTGENTTYAQNVYGLYVSGTANCSNSNFDVKSRINAYGVYGDDTSNLNLSGNKFEAKAITTTGAYGMYSNKDFTTNNDLFSATATTTSAYALSFGSSAKGTILNGKFAAVGTGNFGPIDRNASTSNVVLKGGFYTTSTNLPYYISSECSIFMVDKSEEEYAEGYRYVIADENPARFVCYIGNTGYATLEAAMQYTIDNPSGTYTIVMSQPYTLPSGNYTLPSNASLLIPYKENQNAISTTPTRHYASEVIAEYLRLTVASGVNWNVDGKIEVSSKMFCAEGTTSYVNGAYGCLELKANSILQLNSGAKMYAWGFVVGSGEVKVKGGAEVREFFQALDLPTIGTLFDHKDDYENLKHFPCSQYFIQNIEAPTTYYYNSKLIASMYIGYKGDPYGTDNIKLVGTPTGSSDNYLFQIVDDDPSSWVRKEYNASRDRQIWTIGSKAQLGAMTLTISGVPLLGSVTLNSKDYILPLTTNMTINTVEGGRVELTQSMELLAGAEININKTASLLINQKDSKNEDVNFYVIDASQSYYSTKYVNFSPSWPKSGRPSRSVPDAAINVSGGAIVVKGNFYTTESGANIFSNNDNAGTVSLQKAAPAAGTLSYYSSGTKTKNITPAQLKNGNGTYTPTAGAIAGTDFGYLNSAWHSSYVNGPFTVIDNIVYAKPSEYVQLKTQQTGTNGKLEGVAESDHTYLTIADKILILQGKGTDASPYEWWEVVATATAGVFECQKPGYEGFYSYNTTAGEWQIVKRNVTFYMDEAKTESTKKVVSVNYMGVPDQSVITSNPTKGITIGYTYQFYGWKSSVTTTEYAWTETLEAAENDMYYTPVFTPTKRNYTITFNNADNGAAAKVEAAYETHPQYVPTKDPTAQYTYSFKDWTDNSGNHYLTCDDLPKVTGTATYTANWNSEINVYTVIFKDGEQTLQTKMDQPYGIATSFTGVQPSKEADDEYEYAFDGWVSSQNGTKYNPGNTPSVTGDVTYTAHYATTARYFITFANYDGEVLQKEATTVGEHPVFHGTPRRDADRDGYFRFDGWMDGDGETYEVGQELPAVSKKQTYTARWTYVTTRYTITFTNFDGNGGTWSNQFGEGEIPSYDGATPLAKTSDHPEQYYYEFNGWNPEIVPVTEEKTYTAQWSDPIPVNYTITFIYDGYGNSVKKEYAYGATPVYGETGDPTPHKDDEGEYSYTFTGWKNVSSFPPVTGDATYTAQFSQTLRQYTITFVLNNGSDDVVQLYSKNETPSIEDPTKATTTEWIYTFTGWSPAIAKVLYDATYTAQWNQTGVPYNVTFVDEDGTTVLKATEAVAHGTKPTPPAKDPNKDPVGNSFYTFAGWISSVNGTTYTTANIPAVGTSDVIYKAKYTEFANLVATVTTSAGVTTPYNTWASALSAANASANSTLKLYSNVSAPNNNQITANMTIDLNGHTVSFSGSQNGNTRLFYVNGVALTVNDTKGGGAMSYRNTRTGNNSQAYTIYVNGTASVTIDGGTLRAERTSGNYVSAAVYLYSSNSTLYLNDGELIATENSGGSGYAVSHRGASYGYSYIRGGKLKGKSAIFQNPATARVTLSGGYYSKDPGNSVTIASGYSKRQITSATVDPEYSNGYTYKVAKSCTVTFNANGHGTAPAAVTAYTGDLMSAPTAPLAAGYNFNGWYKESDCIHQWNFASDIVTEAMTLYAKWTPRDDTPYTVKHLWQNVEDDDYTEHESEGMTGTTEASTAAVAKEYTGFTAQDFSQGTIVGDGSTIVEIRYNRNTYAITWVDGDGYTIKTDDAVKYGDTPNYEGATPTKSNSETQTFVFVGWEVETVTGDATYTAKFNAYDLNLNVTTENHEIVDDVTITTTTVTTTGDLNVEEDKTLTTTDLVLEASLVEEEEGSGEIRGAGTVNPTGNVYFDLTLNTWARHWRAFGVPWKIANLKTTKLVEIKTKNGAPCHNELVLGRDYDIVYYNGATRAEQGPGRHCWDYVEDGDGTLDPGKAYLIGFIRPTGTVRFTKEADAPIRRSNETLEVPYYEGNGVGTDAGWNAIANPKTYHATMNAEVEWCHVHNGDTMRSDGFTTKQMSEVKFVVGTAVFVQANPDKSVVDINRQHHSPSAPAPRRVAAREEAPQYHAIHIMANNKSADRIYIKADEDKETDTYTNGIDVAKMGISTVRAQIWVERYNTQLAVNTMAPVNNTVSYPLGISVPQAGEYEIQLSDESSDMIYLTYDNRIIWNLSYSPYVADLEKGTNTHYGIRMVVSKTPAITTDVEEAQDGTQQAVQKIIIEDKVYILRGEQLYTITGQLVQ